MLIRIRSKDGTFRFDLAPTSGVEQLAEKILETTEGADPESLTISNTPRGGETAISTLRGRTVQDLGLRHGDLLFVSYKSSVGSAPLASVEPISPSSTSAPAPVSAPDAKRPWETVKEDPVDTYWRSSNGKIPRQRDPRLCKHGANGMCEYCSPLEPFDQSYHAEHSIKHLSYHAYLRKLSPSQSSNSNALPPLTPLSYRVKVPCPKGSHPPWPAGICSTCQPSAITLQPQPFRMVDHLEFASDAIIDRFLHAWRATGAQRFGWLVGHYEPYDEVPMGIKAVVEAIHEPPQEGELDGLTLGLPWEDEARIVKLASEASKPLTIVGQIFTDLTPLDEDKSKSLYKRHPKSFYLSSLEAIFAARVQLEHRCPSRSSPTGEFSSRVVTAVLCGTEDGGIDLSVYQVSEQACAMVEADMIEASVEPGIVRVKEEDRTADSARYIPDVFFRYKNEYGLDVQKSAKPAFPVEYLLVNITHGFPKVPAPLFRSSLFPIENRPGLEDQGLQLIFNELSQRGVTEGDGEVAASSQTGLANWLSDWHLIAYLGTVGLLSEDDMKLLIKTASSPSLESPSALNEIVKTDGWRNLVAIARESSAPRRPTVPPPAVADNTSDFEIPPEVYDDVENPIADPSVRVCPHCTFENVHGGSDCEVCGLPLG
ncbi:polyubiquitin-tagged protein recognition complex, Npl4 component [Sistotremastrum suecicum HHB10207 ss-3]|uniref:Nuclear protein localization protein 4 n=1 Tax=Sistotremastrum suecicum HHB10207 ss-3 TaxID=1314776 RepID=A0A166J922_9AGAM|nr:polyubiquitin-tagged protein recognition complex, Npl4 component [Sistotremastrum suecicum HHB10207 ss-3]